ncbi:hypothetical protein QBC35DRAFT_504893 [Podospora australis]|uniref:Uncharacterized protein n=1 Tax=Podospora australis TaxID=1536484 RepID=A0AAN7ADV7_9PEZI|nr:hypothetical protein QBC35DRAFT_504893 [Podospora australis]
MAGRLHVDFWVFGFDIDFGDRDKALAAAREPPLGLQAFVDLVLQGAGKTVGSSMPLVDGGWVDVPRPSAEPTKPKATALPFLFNCTDGLLSDSEVPDAGNGPPSADSSWRTAMFADTPIPDDTWAVKAGELEWTATCAFAASAAQFHDERDNRSAAIPKDMPVSMPSLESGRVYALPMRLTSSLTSTVHITVTQKAKHAQSFMRAWKIDNDCRDDRWSVKPILKSVPRSVCGAYNEHTDPSLRGNAVFALLNAPKEKGSVELVTGFTIRPPLPYRSKDQVPKFNLVEDMRLGVKKGGYGFVGVNDKASDKWQPDEPIDGKEKWDVVKTAWDTQDVEDRAQDVVRQWSELMGWPKEKPLTGRRPRALLRRFEDMVPAAPRMTKAF